MPRLPSMPKPNPKPLITPKEFTGTIKQMKKAGQNTKEMETAHKQLQAASDSYTKALAASHKAAGSYHGVIAGPLDVCLTPGPAGPVPIPYPNIAKSKKLADTGVKNLKTAEKKYEQASKNMVKIIDKKIVEMTTKMKRSSGDEAGTLKGIVSSVTMDKAKFMKGSSQVKVEGKKLVQFLDVVKKTSDKQFKTFEKQRKKK